MNLRGPAVAAGAACLLAALGAGPATGQDATPRCQPGGPPVTASGALTPADARTYQLHPVDVAPGTTRVEVDYDYASSSPVGSTPVTQTVVDLGLWDADGYRDAAGFRGWSGSRDRAVFVAQDAADRTYRPGVIEPGTWWVELGIAAVAPDGGSWRFEVRCLASDVGPPPVPDPVDPHHVARPDPGWYHGDFHMHGYHSNPQAPDYQTFVDFARDQGLDFFPLTEYVVPVHWDELGSHQRANPDVLFWPGREVITYRGHVTALGATPGFVEYRAGFEDITMTGILEQERARGALVGIAHPTTFAGPVFANFCRGCGWDYEGQVDWSLADTIEVVTGPVVVRPGGDPRLPGVENPFVGQAVALWERLLDQGVRLTAVAGSDDKRSGDGPDPFSDPAGATSYSPHGVPAVAVYAEELSVAALQEAVLAGRAYVRTRGVAASPALELEAVTPGGIRGTFGASLATDRAEVTVTVTGGAGQLLRVVRGGETIDVVPVTADPFTHDFTATREPGDEGPLGTWWRVETVDHESRTTIANPIFLTDGSPQPTSTPPDGDGRARPPDAPASTPATGGGAGFAAGVVIGAGVLLRAARALGPGRAGQG